MTVERSAFVLMPANLASRALELDQTARAALQRAKKLQLGDRTEELRFEAVHAVIDQLAVAAMRNGAPTVTESVPAEASAWGSSVIVHGASIPQYAPTEVQGWIANGGVVVELSLPHFAGETESGGMIGSGPPASAVRWKSTAGNARAATTERFEFLLAAALDGSSDSDGAIRPSGIANTVLTECLHTAVAKRGGRERKDLRVIYRDGSEGPRFPLRAIRLRTGKPDNWRVLRFTLLSIRHVDMDMVVDGAWLRNSKISRPRAAGLTDSIVFETSRRQLRVLAAGGPTLICLYQTGLEPAIVGFYRAVVHQLLEMPDSIAVLPFHFQGDGRFTEGKLWRAS